VTDKTLLNPLQTAWLDAADGTRLYCESQTPAAPKAALLIVHGFADHCGRYAAMAADFVEKGYAVFRFDYRGHGRSDGKRGHIFAFDDYLQDLRAFRTWAESKSPNLPRFLLAHSNGALISLHGASAEPAGLDGVVLSSPFFGFGVKVPKAKAFVARHLSRRVPALTLATNLNAKEVSHDPAVIEGYSTDPLIGRVASSRWYTETVAAHARCEDAAKALTLPILVQQAGDDRIASAPDTRRVFEQIASSDKTYREYEGLFHEIWFELERAPVMSDLSTWIAAQLASTQSSLNPPSPDL
jgi:lysophospholipase